MSSKTQITQKLQPNDLRRKSVLELQDMLKTLNFMKAKATSQRNKGKKYFDMRNIRRNISRIITILREQGLIFREKDIPQNIKENKQ